jgi:hypothetical protein
MDNERDSIVAAVLHALSKTDVLKRKHADFWNSHKKSAKEMALFSEVFERLQVGYSQKISSWKRCENDPPDIEFLMDGRRFGVEITELVNEDAIRAQIQRSPTYPNEVIGFSPDVAKQRLQELIHQKDQKVENVATQYDELLLLVHIDEPMLSSKDFLGYGLPTPSTCFRRVYVLFSCEPENAESPLLRVQ